MTGAVVLVVAKAPVAGAAKTRLAASVGAVAAARVAAASLLDTIEAAVHTPAATTAVAFTGDVSAAEEHAELVGLLGRCVVFGQRGLGFAERLAAAHADVADRYAGASVVQIGMDSPQVTPGLLASALSRLDTVDAALGPAVDGGWWALALRNPRHAAVLRGVPMSTADTAAATRAALAGIGLDVAALPLMSDVDTEQDARAVARSVPGSRFARAVETELGAGSAAQWQGPQWQGQRWEEGER
ncbi:MULTISPECIES: TIGR04282 family arsenosugar biosynthesis glycosyltransferase [Prauserella salsuginis group]|uniref:DUF2064 domain-containing protein n=1 Tax=Prauserella salsuginis TaxID=387889 RepID=A0ABW6G4N0_9PSEU|nr:MULTISPECIES: DUF2064 domain-containing protein [Prauserella salsuginis group]MCR3718081.1 hypothetical protein [Prauserella flava]MCR3732651.1 hypothetical protein [Prauserella salsuginis]